jgi:hypothetical protein
MRNNQFGFNGEFDVERRDCAVRAFAAYSGKPYSTIHKLFATHGRKTRCGSTGRTVLKVAALLGYKRIACNMTVGKFLDDRQFAKPCVAHISGHLFAVAGGVNVSDDHVVSSRCKVDYYLIKGE